jgi:hypothetical protein
VEIAGPAEVLRDLLAPHATGKLVALRAILFIFFFPFESNYLLYAFLEKEKKSSHVAIRKET